MVISVFMLLVFMLLVFGSAVLAAPMKVKVSKVKGTVEVSAGAGWKALKDGDAVPVGADVRTAAGSGCILTWAGGNVVKVGPMTTMSVEQAEKTAGGDEKSRVNLKDGSVSAHAKKLSTQKSSFEIKTPTAVAGVRGTDILAEIEAGNVTFGVSDGQLEVTVGDEVFVVDDGYLVNIGMDGVFEEPMPIPPAMQQRLNEEFEQIKQDSAEAAAEPEDEAIDDDGGADVDQDDDELFDDLAETVNENIEGILDDETLDDVLDTAGAEYITGDVNVTIEFEN
jgi:hypothetical protein